MRKVRLVNQNDPVRARWANELVESVRELENMGGKGIITADLPSGQVISLANMLGDLCVKAFNTTGGDVPPFSIVQLTGIPYSVETFDFQQPVAAGLYNLGFTLRTVHADESGPVLIGGPLIAFCIGSPGDLPVPGCFAISKGASWHLQKLTMGNFLVRAVLDTVAWLTDTSLYASRPANSKLVLAVPWEGMM